MRIKDVVLKEGESLLSNDNILWDTGRVVKKEDGKETGICMMGELLLKNTLITCEI